MYLFNPLKILAKLLTFVAYLLLIFCSAIHNVWSLLPVGQKLWFVIFHFGNKNNRNNVSVATHCSSCLSQG